MGVQNVGYVFAYFYAGHYYRQVPISNLSAFFSEEGLTVDYCS